jgi:hypothetical protein
MEDILKIRVKDLLNKSQQAAENAVKVLIAKKIKRDIIRKNEKKNGYMKWVSDRVKGIRNIKR